MNKEISPIKFQEIINDLNNQKFTDGLKKLDLLSKQYPNNHLINKLFASLYLKKMDWNNAIKYYEKLLISEKEKFKVYANIGVAFFRLGKINKSIEAFEDSIKDNSNFELSYNNLAISYLEIGMYEKAINSFISTLKLNKNNFFAQKNLINIFNLVKPNNINEHYLININNRINKIGNEHKIKNFNKLDGIKKILSESYDIVENLKSSLLFDETQIYRKNSKDLNCKRHFRIFNTFNVIPKFCFSCYKIQINLKNIVDLIKLYFFFDSLHLENNNIRKCMVETRNNIKGNYKGYIYCEGLVEARIILKEINKVINKDNFHNFKIIIKHGCSEFYKSYPKFEKINFDNDQEIKYNKDWDKIEKKIDKEEPVRLDVDKKVWSKSIQGVNLSDILIIKNWINYADAIGDQSYKIFYDKTIKNNFITKILQSQLNFRKKRSNF